MNMNLTLIANSGIQFHKFQLNFEPNNNLIKPLGFWERFNPLSMRIILELANYIPEQDIWVSKRSLMVEGFIDEQGNVKEDFNPSLLQPLKEESEYFTINDILTPLELFENKWLPIPFFKSNDARINTFGPTNWVRLFLKPLVNSNPRIKSYKAILAIDTQLAQELNNIESPFIFDGVSENTFSLCTNEDMILNYCDANFECGWIEDYITQIVHGGRENIPPNFPSLKHLASYIYFIKYLSKHPDMPDISLFPDTSPPIDVDLVLDIGNANTCGILFESTGSNSFEFKSVKKLSIQDFTNIEHEYSNDFSMRLAFSKCSIGEMGYMSQKFRWPSVVRMGEEARFLINRSEIDINRGEDISTHHSSPKRYLWDDRKSPFQWEFIGHRNFSGPNPVYLKGISEQFYSDGRLSKNVDFGATSNFSRKSLMTLIYLEIFAHAIRQINSHLFRSEHGNIDKPRRLKRVVVTCPTSMVQREQLVLRQCAEEASIAIKRFYSQSYEIELDFGELSKDVEIIPSSRDLGKNLTMLETRKDWIYDEATCCQLVFMYGEISARYGNRCSTFFDIYGKKRSDLLDYNKKSVTVASVDIGAGTTDLMICAYQYDESGIAVLTPIPLYWESFTLAGDDLLYEIIRQMLLEGRLSGEDDRGCIGVVENHARNIGIPNIQDKMNSFFGTDTNNFTHVGRVMRKNFNIQILIPIALQYLEHARRGETDRFMTFDELFKDAKPNPDLLSYFSIHFGFNFEDIRWKLSAKHINNIVETTFEPLLKQISTLIYAYGCDFLLLAGKPTALPRIEDIFLKFYPLSPERIITLGNYRVGKWYPFSDYSGYFVHPKTIVAVGASIALMGGRLDKLSGFRLNMEYLKTKMGSTADYIGVYDNDTKNITSIFMSPDQNRSEIAIAGLPITLAFKQLTPNQYPARPIYVIYFNEDRIVERIREQNSRLSEVEIADQAEIFKNQLKSRMPFSMKIARQIREDKEKIVIESVIDRERKDVSPSLFRLAIQTLQNEKGYWLDTGEFYLSIRD